MAERDYRGRDIIYRNGQRVFHKPTRRIEDCFQIETIAWQFECIDKRNNEKLILTVASGERERLIRKDAEFDLKNTGKKVGI